MRAVLVMSMLAGGLVGCSSGAEVTEPSPAVSPAAATPTTPATTTPAATTPAATTPAATTPATGASSTGDVPTGPVTPDGFDLVQATVTTADGEVCDLCLWLADSARRRSQGLMGVTDLGQGDGMAFVYGSPHTGNFWMKNTPMPLSIAFFDPEGVYLDGFEMEPCDADPCPLYPTPSDFLVAIETGQGDLGSLGISEGSRLTLTELPCP